MADFIQNSLVTTLHDLGTAESARLESLVEKYTRRHRLGLVLPVTATDMRAAPFSRIVGELEANRFVDTILVTLGQTSSRSDYEIARELVSALGDKGHLLWVDGARVEALYAMLEEAGLRLGGAGKGRAAWTAFGYLLADPQLKTFAIHDCDIVTYEGGMLTRLCFPMVHPGLDFEFCKAYYARTTDRMHGRVVRLLVTPLLKALTSIVGADRFLEYLNSFRYPLAGEFAISANLARTNRIPSDWGLEIGTLAEVFRNTSLKRVCQVDLGRPYEHKHQPLSLEEPDQGLMKMATDILTTIFRTLSSMGTRLSPDVFTTLRAAYLRAAQDAVRQYYADALTNGLVHDRHHEEEAIDGFAGRIVVAGQLFQEDPSGGEAIPNWTRVLAAFPDFPDQLRQAAREDAESGE